MEIADALAESMARNLLHREQKIDLRLTKIKETKCTECMMFTGWLNIGVTENLSNQTRMNKEWTGISSSIQTREIGQTIYLFVSKKFDQAYTWEDVRTAHRRLFLFYVFMAK